MGKYFAFNFNLKQFIRLTFDSGYHCTVTKFKKQDMLVHIDTKTITTVYYNKASLRKAFYRHSLHEDSMNGWCDNKKSIYICSVMY